MAVLVMSEREMPIASFEAAVEAQAILQALQRDGAAIVSGLAAMKTTDCC